MSCFCILEKVENFVLDAIALPHILNKNDHILWKIRARVAFESVFKIVIQ